MIDPSESARRIESTFQRFGVATDGTAFDAGALGAKRGLGLALPAFTEKVRGELESSQLPDSGARMVKLRLKQIDDVAKDLAQAPASDRFEAPELALVASFLDVTVTVLALAMGKEYRSASP